MKVPAVTIIQSSNKYDTRTIRNQLKDSVLLKGIHYVRPFGGHSEYTQWHIAD